MSYLGNPKIRNKSCLRPTISLDCLEETNANPQSRACRIYTDKVLVNMGSHPKKEKITGKKLEEVTNRIIIHQNFS